MSTSCKPSKLRCWIARRPHIAASIFTQHVHHQIIAGWKARYKTRKVAKAIVTDTNNSGGLNLLLALSSSSTDTPASA
eukprot:4037874-Amphidinium_carterae.1